MKSLIQSIKSLIQSNDQLKDVDCSNMWMWIPV